MVQTWGDRSNGEFSPPAALFSGLDGVKPSAVGIVHTCPEAVDRHGASLRVLGKPPVAQSLKLCDLCAGAGTCTATLLVGAD